MSEPVVVYEPKRQEVLPAPHSLEENERTIEQGLGTFVEVGEALMEIRDSRQYIKAGWDTFEDYCKQRWDMGRDAADDQIAASKVVAVLDAEHAPQTIRSARPLARLLAEDGPDAVRTAWKQITERHEGDGPITGREVLTFLKPNLGVPPSKRPLSDAYLGALDKLKPALSGIRWALTTYRGKAVPTQVREQYAESAQTVRALADVMDSIAAGEELDLDAIHERLDVGVWDR